MSLSSDGGDGLGVGFRLITPMAATKVPRRVQNRYVAFCFGSAPLSKAECRIKDFQWLVRNAGRASPRPKAAGRLLFWDLDQPAPWRGDYLREARVQYRAATPAALVARPQAYPNYMYMPRVHVTQAQSSSTDSSSPSPSPSEFLPPKIHDKSQTQHSIIEPPQASASAGRLSCLHGHGVRPPQRRRKLFRSTPDGLT